MSSDFHKKNSISSGIFGFIGRLLIVEGLACNFYAPNKTSKTDLCNFAAVTDEVARIEHPRSHPKRQLAEHFRVTVGQHRNSPQGRQVDFGGQLQRESRRQEPEQFLKRRAGRYSLLCTQKDKDIIAHDYD